MFILEELKIGRRRGARIEDRYLIRVSSSLFLMFSISSILY